MRVIKNAANNDPAATLDSHLDCRALLIQIVALQPSFGAFYYIGGNKDLDLDYPLEFRMQLEFGYRFDDRSRLSLGVSRYENFGLGDSNPGVESAIIYYSMPFDMLFDRKR